MMLFDDESCCDLLAAASEIQRNRLYFIAFKKNYKPKSTPHSHFFSIDDEYVYENFYNDFGPLNICMLYRYCEKLNTKMNAKSLQNKRIVHYTSMNSAKRLNAAYLIGSYSIIYLNKTPEEAYRPLVTNDIPAYTRYCDASYGPSNFKISLIDCLNAVFKSLKAGFFKFDDFDAEEYEYFERVENGDFNWIVPQKFIAFCGPHQKSKTLPNGYPCHSPETYFDYFRVNNVTTVIRLNAKVYHASSFENAGFDHKDLFFIDGSTPSDLILKKFLAICETTKGAIAVHCKAGLGRTGSLIGAYIMKHYNFSALEAIAWLRLCRPGSVIGHQQQWMEDKQSWLWAEGERVRKRGNSVTPVHRYGIYSLLLKGRPRLECNENTEILSTRVRGISQKVDTMHLHDMEDATNENGNVGCSNNNFKSTLRSPVLTRCKDTVDGGSTSLSDPDELEDDSSGSCAVTRRRKSPNILANDNQSGLQITRSTPPIGERIPFTTEPLQIEKKLKKPSGLYEVSAFRPTISSTVKMSQAAIDKKNAQTQGDKLNQIKALRRQQHTSRITGLTINNTDEDNAQRHTRARSQPFRNNNSNIPNVLLPTVMQMKLASTATAASTNVTVNSYEQQRSTTNNNNSNIINHNNNNNNNNNINNNHLTITAQSSLPTNTTTATTTTTTTVGNVTTRARSLALYTKRPENL